MALHSLRQQRETGCIDYEILAFDEAEPPQFIEQREIMRCIARARKQAAKAINASGLLAARRERPRRRAAEKGDEIASSQVWHGLSPPRAAGPRTPQPSMVGQAGPGRTPNRR